MPPHPCRAPAVPAAEAVLPDGAPLLHGMPAATLAARPPPAQVDQRYEGGCSKGELTLVGQEQAREFGRWLRWRYHMVLGLLPERHEPGAVNARSTNYSRTIATLQVGWGTGFCEGSGAGWEG